MNIQELHERLRLAGEEWAEADYAASLLEETKKSVLSQEMQRFAGLSNAAAEAKAMGSDVYLNHIREMSAARREANKARVRYDSAKMFVELLRTQEATKRAEMRL